MRGIKESACLLLSIAFVCSALSVVNAEDDDCEWLVLVYLDADNSLDLLTETDLDELMEVGSTGDLEVYTLVDRLEDVAHLYHIMPGAMDLVEEFPLDAQEVNMGSPDTLRTFFEFTYEASLPKHVLLFFWDHGSGTAGVASDDTPYDGATASDWLTHQEVMAALSGKTVDVIGCDECMVGQIETLYEYRVVGYEQLGMYVPYFVASENFISNRGFTYDEILRQMQASIDETGSVCPRKVATICVETFEDMMSVSPYMSEIVTTYSAYDMAYIKPAGVALSALADELVADMAANLQVVKAAYKHSTMVWGATPYEYIDMPGFVQWVGDNTANEDISAAAQTLLDIMPDLVFVMGVTQNSDNYGYNGIGVFFPINWNQLTNSYPALIDAYSAFQLPNDGWLDMLEAYFGVA